MAQRQTTKGEVPDYDGVNGHWRRTAQLTDFHDREHHHGHASGHDDNYRDELDY